MLKKLSSRHELHHEVQFLWSLEGVLQRDQKWMVYVLENHLLCFGVFQLIQFDDVLFFKDFDGIDFSTVFFLAQNDFPKSPLSEHFHQIEIFYAQFLLIRVLIVQHRRSLSQLSLPLKVGLLLVDEFLQIHHLEVVLGRESKFLLIGQRVSGHYRL